MGYRDIGAGVRPADGQTVPMPLQLLQVDAFTDRPFTGNPAGVCLLPAGDWPDGGWMQAVAAEVNAAETAFLRPTGPGTWDLRWFTPTVEVDLCGHATLASAHALRTQWGANDSRLSFSTRSGELVVTVDGERLELDLPADPPSPAPEPPGLQSALGLVGDDVEVLASRTFEVVVLGSSDEVTAVIPDMAALAEVSRHGVVVTAPGAAGDDVASRMFAPAVGIPEDPVTGSAHAVVAPLWATRLGRNPLRCRQLSARGGTLVATVDGDRVRLAGTAVTTIEATLSEAAGPIS